jgi:hypothetical protein
MDLPVGVPSAPDRTDRVAEPADDARAKTTGSRTPDTLVVLAYLVVAAVVVSPLWFHLDGGHLGTSLADQTAFEWHLSYAAHAVTAGENPLFTTRMGAPHGVNLIANTSVLGLGVPLTPLTLVLGPTVSLATALTGALAGTATAWYWLLSRRLLPILDAGAGGRTLHLAAAIAAALIGFSPTQIAHAAGAHLNLVSQFVVPFIVWRVTRLHHRPVRDGVLLGLLVAYQLFVGEEILLYTALAMGVYTTLWALQRPRAARAVARRFLAGLGMTSAVAVLITAYPLWTQFFGRQSYPGLPHMQGLGLRLPALVHYSTESIGGVSPLPPGLVPHPSEENGFFGWSLPVLAVAAAAWLWRRSAPARAVAITAVLFMILATGRDVIWTTGGVSTPGPWRLLGRLPVLESAAPARLATVVTVCIAILLAAAVCRLRGSQSLAAAALITGLTAVLIPLAPTPLTVDARATVPAFFTDGHWQRFVRPGHTLVSARHPDMAYSEPMRWQMEAGFGFRINGGYFIGPGATEGSVGYTAAARPTEDLLGRAIRAGQPQPVTDEDRRAALDDLRAWNADAIVLDARDPAAREVRTTMGRLFPVPEQLVGGVWVWDVRSLYT